jgi:sulfite exporter TauE/SafE
MSLLPEVTNPYLTSLALGLFSGLAFCTSACLPYVASYIAGIGAGFRRGVLVTAIYNFGRIAAYAIVGASIAVMRFSLDDAFFIAYQDYALVALGIVSIAIGASVILKSRKPSCSGCAVENSGKTGGNRLAGRFDLRAFSLGLTRGLIVCPLLAQVLLISVTSAAPVDSFFIALLFGVGTALSPLLLFAGVTGWLLNKAPLWRKWIQVAGGAVLVLLGISALASAAFGG